MRKRMVSTLKKRKVRDLNPRSAHHACWFSLPHSLLHEPSSALSVQMLWSGLFLHHIEILQVNI